MRYNYTILYAPSWENDNKEDDFIQALSKLPVNLLIKQAPWSLHYSHIIENIIQMRKMHEGKYNNLYYMENEDSILDALSVANLVISDESNVTLEALMYKIPSICITDWLIPDEYPSRFSNPNDCVWKCKISELESLVRYFLEDSTKYQDKLNDYFDYNFSNVGHCCDDILDAIEYYTQGAAEKNGFKRHKLESKYFSAGMWN